MLLLVAPLSADAVSANFKKIRERRNPISRLNTLNFIESRYCLSYLNEKCRLTEKNTIRCSETSKYAVDRCQPTALCGNVTSDLSQNCDETGLPQHGRFTTHVWTWVKGEQSINGKDQKVKLEKRFNHPSTNQ